MPTSPHGLSSTDAFSAWPGHTALKAIHAPGLRPAQQPGPLPPGTFYRGLGPTKRGSQPFPATSGTKTDVYNLRNLHCVSAEAHGSTGEPPICTGCPEEREHGRPGLTAPVCSGEAWRGVGLRAEWVGQESVFSLLQSVCRHRLWFQARPPTPLHEQPEITMQFSRG